VGGLSRDLPINFNDVDLSLKIRATGKRIIWTPFAQLYHFESKTRDVFVGPAEVDRIQRRWGHVFDRGDPYWRHLELTHAPRQFELVVD
jgi:GT2 family glycosyltransferase